MFQREQINQPNQIPTYVTAMSFIYYFFPTLILSTSNMSPPNIRKIQEMIKYSRNNKIQVATISTLDIGFRFDI